MPFIVREEPLGICPQEDLYCRGMDEAEVAAPAVESVIEPPREQAVSPERAGMSNASKIAIGVGIVVVLFAAQAWMSGRKAEGERRAMFSRAVDALAVSLDPLILDSKYRQKAPVTVMKVSQAGRFDLVEIADRDGMIIGSTNRQREGKPAPDMANPPIQPRIEVVDGKLRATRAILLGSNNVIGTLRVEVSDE